MYAVVLLCGRDHGLLCHCKTFMLPRGSNKPNASTGIYFYHPYEKFFRWTKPFITRAELDNL